MYIYKGKTALITGASSGIGEAFARMLAARGMHVVLVARSEARLKALAAELAQQHGVRTSVIVADLSLPAATRHIYETVKQQGLIIDMLVNNAGFSTYGNFETISPALEQAEIAVNVASLVDLTHAFVPAMLERGDGAVINVASVGSFFSLAKQAVYASTKSFVLSFSEALYVEYRQRGVRVFALCPGAVDTGFNDVIKVDIAVKGDTPERVVAAGLRAFERGRHYVIPGTLNYISAGIVPRLMPRGLFARLFASFTSRVVKPRDAVGQAQV